ncbi:MAG: SIS domain-containing protein [Bacteroidetes bacterium]|nr:SIS domain-containing protein [Bacteroidota bacterium]
MFAPYIDNFNHIISSAETSVENFTAIEINKAFALIIVDLEQLAKQKGTVYLIGNGGSSGIISHSSVDFINSCKIKAVPLSDNSQLTCFANDYGYEQVFSKPLEILIGKNDMLIAISSSGSSMNIINAVKTARQKQAKILTLSGFNPDNPLRALGNYNFWLNSDNYGRVEIGHALLLHLITDYYSHKLI